MQFIPCRTYRPDFETYKNLDQAQPNRYHWSMRLRTTLNEQIEARYESDEQVTALIEHYNNDDIRTNDIVEVDIRLLKWDKYGVDADILEHGVYDFDKKKVIWQNPIINPIVKTIPKSNHSGQQ